MAESTISVRDVHQAVRAGRVHKAPSFHMGKHGLSFEDVLVALERCTEVARDRRTRDGRPRHPLGWCAIATLPHGRRAQIDFNAVTDGDVRLYIVTGYRIP